MNKYYFTFGTDRKFPFINGYIIIEAPNGKSAVEIFKAYFPNRPGSSAINCSFMYTEEKFMEDWDWCWSKSECHGVIAFRESKQKGE